MTILWSVLLYTLMTLGGLLFVLLVLNLFLGWIFIPEIGKSSKKADPNMTSERQRFEDQFNKPPEKIARGLWAYHLVPGRFQIRSSIPILFVPGGVPNILSAKEILWQLYLQGREIYVADSPHGISVPFGRGYFLRRFVAAQMALLDHFQLTNVSVVAHSAGALIAVKVAIQRPSVFRAFVLVAPSGAIGPDSLGQLRSRFAESVADENRLRETGQFGIWWEEGNAWRRGPQYYFGLSLLQTFFESKAIAEESILPGLHRLGFQEARVVVVHGKSDYVYPIQRVADSISKMVHQFVPVECGRHQDLILSPHWHGSIVYEAILWAEKN
jgi:pimeloyl-ACP methyl ester carboxylesterase